MVLVGRQVVHYDGDDNHQGHRDQYRSNHVAVPKVVDLLGPQDSDECRGASRRVQRDGGLHRHDGGGDGYGGLRDPNATDDTGERLIANDVMVYARKLGKIEAKVEGRLVFR